MESGVRLSREDNQHGPSVTTLNDIKHIRKLVLIRNLHKDLRELRVQGLLKLNTRGTSSPDRRRDNFFCHSLGNSCSELQEDILATLIGLNDGTGNGQPKLTQAVPYKLHDSPATRLASTLFTSGSGCNIQHGYTTFGLLPSRMQSLLNLSLWTSSIPEFSHGPPTCTTTMVVDVQPTTWAGRLQRIFNKLKPKLCIGRTGRRWRPRPARRHRCRRRRTLARNQHVCIARLGSWLLLLTEIILCPSPRRVLHVMLSRLLLYLQVQVCCAIWLGHALSAPSGFQQPCQAAMSDSSVEERPPQDRPAGPAGPPPPLPAQAQQEASHRISAAVAQELSHQGEVLTYPMGYPASSAHSG